MAEVRLTVSDEEPCRGCGSHLRRIVAAMNGPWPNFAEVDEVVVTVTPTLVSCAGCGEIIPAWGGDTR